MRLTRIWEVLDSSPDQFIAAFSKQKQNKMTWTLMTDWQTLRIFKVDVSIAEVHIASNESGQSLYYLEATDENHS
jgi:hypothetical protein